MITKINDVLYYTLTDVSYMHNVPRNLVYKAIEAGRIKGFFERGRVLADKEFIDTHLHDKIFETEEDKAKKKKILNYIRALELHYKALSELKEIYK